MVDGSIQFTEITIYIRIITHLVCFQVGVEKAYKNANPGDDRLHGFVDYHPALCIFRGISIRFRMAVCENPGKRMRLLDRTDSFRHILKEYSTGNQVEKPNSGDYDGGRLWKEIKKAARYWR